jgi:ketol-acid reductoisomerase
MTALTVALQRDTIISESLSPAPKIVIANNSDSYGSKAEEDGFAVTSDWPEIAKEADVLFLLVPDQVRQCASSSVDTNSISLGSTSAV